MVTPPLLVTELANTEGPADRIRQEGREWAEDAIEIATKIRHKEWFPSRYNPHITTPSTFEERMQWTLRLEIDKFNVTAFHDDPYSECMYNTYRLLVDHDSDSRTAEVQLDVELEEVVDLIHILENYAGKVRVQASNTRNGSNFPRMTTRPYSIG